MSYVAFYEEDINWCLWGYFGWLLWVESTL